MNQPEDTTKRDFDIGCSEEDEYLWAFSYFQAQIGIIKKCNEEFSKYLKVEDKRLDDELWKDKGIGFKNWLEDIKEINKVRRISTYKNPLMQVSIKNPFFKA